MRIVEQLMRFLMVGGAATALQYVILVALVQLELTGAVAASNIGFAISAVLNYAANRTFTFRSERRHIEALPRFAAVALGGLAVNATLMWLCHRVAGLHYLVAQVLATCATLLWNFTLNRLWTFSAETP
jgi:putative flippase GtrA